LPENLLLIRNFKNSFQSNKRNNVVYIDRLYTMLYTIV